MVELVGLGSRSFPDWSISQRSSTTRALVASRVEAIDVALGHERSMSAEVPSYLPSLFASLIDFEYSEYPARANANSLLDQESPL